MKVVVNENELKSLIEESIRKVLLRESYGKDPHKMVFATFGKGTKYDAGKLASSPRSEPDALKPSGLWGSPIWDWNNKSAWGSFVEHDYRERIDTLKEHFLFRLKPDAKIYVVNSEKSIRNLPWRWDVGWDRNYVDWAKVEKMYDGVYLIYRPDVYLEAPREVPHFLHWDCDSICIFNPNAIEQIEESEDDYNKIRNAYDYERNPYEYETDPEYMNEQ